MWCVCRLLFSRYSVFLIAVFSVFAYLFPSPMSVNYAASNVAGLADRVVGLEKNHRTVVAIAGVPGSGKTTIAALIADELNKRGVSTVVIPQDGFHLYRHELQALPNAEEAVARRGAPFTFNSKRLVELVRRLRDPETAKTTITAPSFDHRLKDPVEDDIVVLPSVKVVLLEGNYVGLKEHPWAAISGLVDELWLVKAAPDLVRRRIVARHVKTGVTEDEESAVRRFETNDWPNAEYIMANTAVPNVIVQY